MRLCPQANSTVESRKFALLCIQAVSVLGTVDKTIVQTEVSSQCQASIATDIMSLALHFFISLASEAVVEPACTCLVTRGH